MEEIGLGDRIGHRGQEIGGSRQRSCRRYWSLSQCCLSRSRRRRRGGLEVAFPEVWTSSLTFTRQRLKLADNVVCLFEHDKDPVINPPHHSGRYPHGVVSLRLRDRIRPGVYCYITKAGPNHLRIALVLGRSQGSFKWEVMAVGPPFATFDKHAPSQYVLSTVIDVQSHHLRRCAQPVP